MTCKELIEFLDDYYAGDQPAEVRAEFEKHLATCSECVDYLRTYENTVRLAQAASLCDEPAATADDAPEELIQAILAARSKQAD